MQHSFSFIHSMSLSFADDLNRKKHMLLLVRCIALITQKGFILSIYLMPAGMCLWVGEGWSVCVCLWGFSICVGVTVCGCVCFYLILFVVFLCLCVSEFPGCGFFFVLVSLSVCVPGWFVCLIFSLSVCLCVREVLWFFCLSVLLWVCIAVSFCVSVCMVRGRSEMTSPGGVGRLLK